MAKDHALLTIFFPVPVHARQCCQSVPGPCEGERMFLNIFSRLVACGCQSRVENLFSLAGRLIRTAKGQGKMRGPQRPEPRAKRRVFFKIHDPLFA